jgi:ribosomal protein S12 methylthiotransferase
VFTYSHEEGTHAWALADDVPARVKRERRRRLMQCQQRIVFARNAARLGSEVEVLVEGAHPETEHLLVGRTAGQAPEVDGQVLIHEGHAQPGEFVRVELREAAGYDLVGAIVGPAGEAGAGA